MAGRGGRGNDGAVQNCIFNRFRAFLLLASFGLEVDGAADTGLFQRPAPNAINILQACTYKSVSTGLFSKSLWAPSIVKLNVEMIHS